jgi:hypothetical protein
MLLQKEKNEQFLERLLAACLPENLANINRSFSGGNRFGLRHDKTI